ncbi:hypothetical protein B0H13DRAFT_2277729 [Mycena leptocephala]|nr:hypothetical protein B0H13DRAFT_2277729 [Mycena leptocephala]
MVENLKKILSSQFCARNQNFNMKTQNFALKKLNLGTTLGRSFTGPLTGYTLWAALFNAKTQEEVEFLEVCPSPFEVSLFSFSRVLGRRTARLARCGAFSCHRVFPITDPESKKTTLYFAFPDLAVRAIGEFRLGFTLSLLGPHMSIYSAPFSVLTAANYGESKPSYPSLRDALTLLTSATERKPTPSSASLQCPVGPLTGLEFDVEMAMSMADDMAERMPPTLGLVPGGLVLERVPRRVR